MKKQFRRQIENERGCIFVRHGAQVRTFDLSSGGSSGRARLCGNCLTKQRALVKQTGQVWLVAGRTRGLSDNNGRAPH